MPRKRWLALVVVLCVATGAAGQEVVDDSGSILSDERRRALFAALEEQLADPYSAKISRLVAVSGAVCGFVNGKNLLGAYTGIMPFVFTDFDQKVMVVPRTNDSVANLQRTVLEVQGCATTP